MSQRSTLQALLVVGLFAAPSLAMADPLADAETAYSRVEFGDTERLARAALTSGGYDRAHMIRIYFLIGVSATADGKDDEAIQAFKRLLALDPETKADRGLSPKLQGTMLEAKGSPPPPLACEVVFDRGKGSLHFTIRDELGMGRSLLVRSRLADSGEFTDTRGPSGASVDVALPGAAGVEHLEYTYQLLDDHQNRLVEKGSDSAPEVFQLAAAPQGEGTGSKKIPTKWLAVGIVGELLGVVGLAGGIGAYVVGNDAANRWNNDSICLVGGKSRNTNCSGDKSKAQAAESGSIASFALGGVFIVASTILLIAAPRVERERTVASSFQCGAGPGVVGLACGAKF